MGAAQVEGALGEVVLSLGKSDFNDVLHGFCRTIIPCEYEHCFIFPRRGRPRISFVGASERGSYDTISTASGTFLDGGYSRDPVFVSYGRRRAPVISSFNLDEHENVPEEFRKVLNVRQVITVLARIDRDVCYLGFGLEDGPGNSSRIDAIDQAVRNYGNILLRLVHRHDQLTTASRLLRITQLGLSGDAANSLNREEFVGILSEIFATRTALSVRESEICAYMVFGYSVDATALILEVSPHTVGTHRKRAFAKLGISNQSDLFAILHAMMNN